jgi:ubiquinone/menaquinone biosynthesis C-methylase UbiE
MRWYGEHIFPHLMEWVMGGEEFQKQRSLVLARAYGTVLEIGFGTGLNLPHYPATLSSLHAIDPAQVLPRKVAERSAAVSFPLQIQRTSAETLPYADRTFDCIVSTWTLCTIPDPVKALRDVRRVLKPDGVFLFLEHGRSEDEKVATWQDRLNPVQNIIGCGCNLNRKIDQIIAQAGLKIMTLDRFLMQRVPRLGGEMYRGVATRPDYITGRPLRSEEKLVTETN